MTHPFIRPAARRSRPALTPLAALAALAACAGTASRAQTAEPASAAVNTPAATTTTPTPASAGQVIVTGNPLGSARLAQPATVLSGEGLALRRSGTLGDTLDGLPGVSASTYGPQASRPVIRGLDGDRVRLLDNGGASADASNLSFDHAVALDPLVVERIEVLRGPAALLYGGNATGGVVNAIDNRIPRQPLQALSGRVELRLGGAAAERASAALLEGGQSGLNWHLDAAQRLSADLRTPRFNPVADAAAGPPTTRVVNSAGQSRSAAFGVSWADAMGFAGLAVDDHHNNYGVTVEPDVTIRLQRQRLQLATERRLSGGALSAWSLQASQTRYQHQELEGSGAVGTTFASRGQDLRLQATQTPLALPGLAAGAHLGGAFGLQAESLDFSALGSEAFVPSTHTRSLALYTLQTLTLNPVILSAGARIEQVRVRSDGDAAGTTEDRFGRPAERRFTPSSLSLALQWPLAAGWAASASLGRTQRAPAYYELFADGVHVATGAYERGNPQQALERSRHAELGLQWQRGADLLRLAAFTTRFANYIALDASGQAVAVEGPDGQVSSVPEYRFTGVPARLQGFEIEARARLAEAPWALDGHASLDAVRGSNGATGAALPRLAPLRAQAGLEAARGAWRLGAQWRVSARQDRVSDGDLPTPGAGLLDLWGSWRQRLGGADAVWTLKLSNLGDVLAYQASSLRTARLLAPAGGRSLWAGLRLGF